MKRIVMVLLFLLTIPSFALAATVDETILGKDYVEWKTAGGSYRILVVDGSVDKFFVASGQLGVKVVTGASKVFNVYSKNADGSVNLLGSGSSELSGYAFTGTTEVLRNTKNIYDDSMSVVWFPKNADVSYPVDDTPPVITSSLAEGTYTENQQVTLSSNENATIYFSLDGSTPTTSSDVYTNPILITETKTIKYFGEDEAGNVSDVVSLKITIERLSDRDGDGISDAEDIYPDDPENIPPAYDESSEAEDNKKTQSILIMLLGVGLTALVMGGKGIL